MNENEQPSVADENANTQTENIRKKPKKQKFSGAYYYVAASVEKLAEKSFIRTVVTVIGLILQITVLLFLPQGGLKYVTETIPSYAYAYVWIVFVMLAVSIYIIIMNFTRYKFVKRIPVERAPKKGFTHRAFFGHELYVAMYAVILAVEISFVCIHYDVYGLIAVFICAAALAAAVAARQITHLTLKDAELINA